MIRLASAALLVVAGFLAATLPYGIGGSLVVLASLAGFHMGGAAFAAMIVIAAVVLFAAAMLVLPERWLN